MSYLFDTNICVYFLKGLYPVLPTKMLSVQPVDIKVPAIVKAELLYGAEKSIRRAENLEKISAFLYPFEIIPFNDAAAVFYGTIRAYLEKKGQPIGPNDLIIAATALANNAVLITNNTKEFARIPELKLENWTIKN